QAPSITTGGVNNQRGGPRRPPQSRDCSSHPASITGSLGQGKSPRGSTKGSTAGAKKAKHPKSILLKNATQTAKSTPRARYSHTRSPPNTKAAAAPTRKRIS